MKSQNNNSGYGALFFIIGLILAVLSFISLPNYSINRSDVKSNDIRYLGQAIILAIFAGSSFIVAAIFLTNNE